MTIKPISHIAQQLGIPEQHLYAYGTEMAKVDFNLLQSSAKKGKLVLVSSITPTPLGEGKTVNTIGLSQGLNHIGKKTVACIRQPSLGPVFGVKGGAAGGGKSQVLPMEKLNLHLTGDFHAITAAHNLAAAALDARLFHEEQLADKFTEQTGLPRLYIDPNRITWTRVIDHNDRALRHIRVGVGGGVNGYERNDGFEITAASELMAILALSIDLADMRKRIGRIILAYNTSGDPITADMLEVAGAMTILMKDALKPTLMQSTEGTPVLIHAGPFANIAHGNSSVLADRIALQLADFVVTEAGFGSDMGMEKFFNIKYRQSGISPSCVVLVATIRSLKANSGKFNIRPGQALPAAITEPNLDLLKEGSENLRWHISNAKKYGLPVAVAINRFPSDSAEEIAFIKEWVLHSCQADGCELSEAFTLGGEGTASLARLVAKLCEQQTEKATLLYPDELPLLEKIELQVKKAYGAKSAILSEQALQQVAELEKLGFAHLPLCMAKTQFSISDDASLKPVPTDFAIHISAVKVSAGAGFIRLYAGNILTMPGLSSKPAYRLMDIDEQGNIVGLS